MRQNVFDTATDILKERMGNANLLITKMFKGARPYRQEPKSDEDRIRDYMQWANDPQMEQQLRQEFGNEGVDKMHTDMQELITRRNPNARF
ncbi:hypothetical protein LCGC14_0560870 [marine sediment metagenome]|uniref:Uncharacterized protein n=1 Tax=marine sediment metagenome TaxID=412755 RepID=A0A0F9U8F3_9ZZZZ